MKTDILDSSKLIETMDQLCMRIEERFPDSSLYKVARQIHDIAKETDQVTHWIQKPNIWLRLLVGTFIGGGLLGLGFAVSQINFAQSTFSIGDIVQVGEAALNEIVILGAAILFLVSIENRAKRKKVIQAVNRLRSFAHIIDAHQLTKDPHSLIAQNRNTVHSPKRLLSPYELGRYLDYCSELLSLTGKIGFLHAQAFDDPAAVQSVNELENLVNSLSQKIWQKIVIIQNTEKRGHAGKPQVQSQGQRQAQPQAQTQAQTVPPASAPRHYRRRETENAKKKHKRAPSDNTHKQKPGDGGV